MSRYLVLLLAITGLVTSGITGCATSSSKPQDSASAVDSANNKDDDDAGSASEEDVHEVGSFRVSDPESPKVTDPELMDVPQDATPQVQKWLTYFQGRGRPHMERYLARSTRYMKLMKRILRDKGMPEELIYISLIESGFSSRATSHAAAVGYWQFIKPTGRRYGLQVNQFVDERRDPVLSTQAAAEYFKELYNVFGSWYLAMAAYNVGENRIKKEVRRNFTRDFWALARRRRLPRETLNYVPKFFAAKLIVEDPEKYGFSEVDYEPAVEFDHVVVKHAVNLRTIAEKIGLTYEEFKLLNPKFRGEMAPVKVNGELEFRVPFGKSEEGKVAAAEARVEKVVFVADNNETDLYKIRKGDTLSTVARRFRTNVAVLRDLNNFTKKTKLRVGSRIQVPERAPASQSLVENRTPVEIAQPAITKGGDRFYFVQKGDTLTSIADRYQTSVSNLRSTNHFGRGSRLKVGRKIRIPANDDKPTSVASPKPGHANIIVEQAAQAAVEAAFAQGAGPGAAAPTKGPGDVHIVKRGENLFVIAKRYGTTVGALKKTNNLPRKTVLRVGDEIKIPSNDDQG